MYAKLNPLTLIVIIAGLMASNARAEVNPALKGIQTGNAILAPEALNAESYMSWIELVRKELKLADFASAFTYGMFDWFENEKERDLPLEVSKDEEKIYVDVERAKKETTDLEDVGEIESSTTIGADVYAEMDGTIDEVMNVMLYRWGKPVNAQEGETHPDPSPFSLRAEYFAPNAEWGPNAFANISSRKNGGLLNDLDDRYIVLIYGNQTRGYDFVMQYFAPAGKTATKKSIAMGTMRPLKNGKTAFKISTRYQGQNYGVIPFGRSLFGFNVGKVRGVQVDFSRMLAEYKKLGRIVEAVQEAR